MFRFYIAQHGENAESFDVMILAPTGMVVYHAKGNTVHNESHIDSNKSKRSPVRYSDLIS